MKKSFMLMVTVLFFSLLLVGCTELTSNDYELWKDSEEAEDLNGDRKIDELDYDIYLQQGSYITWKVSDEAEDLNDDSIIDEVDYAIFLANIVYQAWRNSDDAEDLNGDRKIDILDYELFLNPPISEYEIWVNSNEASDLNSDGSINEADYTIFLEFSEFLGDYTVTNYSFDGSEYMFVGNKIYVVDLGSYLEEIIFTIDSNGDITADIPNSTIAIFEDNFSIVLQALDNMTISRISSLIVGIDTLMTIDNVDINVSLYFTEIENGFRTSYQLNYGGETGVIYFDLIKE